jgi:DNA-binding NarL/FixJ family response regulator
MTDDPSVPSPRPARILIVDDHPLVREGLAVRISLQPDLEVCGEASDLPEAFELVKSLGPDLVIVDMKLKSGHGLDLIKRIQNHCPQVKVLVCSMYDDSLYAERALRAGALGYINKRESREKVVEAIRCVLSGQRYLSNKILQHVLRQALGTNEQPASSPTDVLTDRELQVFQLIGQGCATGEIAQRLHLSVHTIDTHREKIKSKLNVRTAAELSRVAVQWALENG